MDATPAGSGKYLWNVDPGWIWPLYPGQINPGLSDFHPFRVARMETSRAGASEHCTGRCEISVDRLNSGVRLQPFTIPLRRLYLHRPRFYAPGEIRAQQEQ